VLDHVGLGFPTTCVSCHTMDNWVSAKFDHLKYTGYALTGTHATSTMYSKEHLPPAMRATRVTSSTATIHRMCSSVCPTIAAHATQPSIGSMLRSITHCMPIIP
jgi:hypothetical protein